MTRYSRSVIPGRPSEEGRSEAADADNLDRIVFGSKKKPIMPPANDRDYPDPMEMDVDEAGFLVDRSTKDRRAAKGDRRVKADRRKAEGRRNADYVPLRENGAPYRGGDASGRGPILLVGALVIVAVFGVVVWNAYREGVRTDDPEATPKLATAGAFKTPPRDVTPTAVAAAEPIDVLEQLEGGPAPVADTPPEVRPEPVVAAPVQAAVAPAPTTPAPSKFTAPPPAPLKQPVTVAAAPATTSAKPSLDIPKPTATPQATTTVAAAPVAAAPAPAGAFKPAFAAGGKWLVQVAAPSTEAGASAEWDKRVKALPEFFAAAERVVVQADVNGKTVYRLRAGAFASKADADAFCSAYKAKGGNCFPAAR